MIASPELSVLISRDSLGLHPLEIAVGEWYYCSPKFLGAVVSWSRQQVQSPWVEGSVTVSRHRQMVTERIGVEVRAPSDLDLQSRINDLVAAFTQDAYTLSVTLNGASYVYQCEAADYQTVMWTAPRLHAHQAQVLFSMPRQPVALVGDFPYAHVVG